MNEIDSQCLKGIKMALLSVNSPHYRVIDRILASQPVYDPGEYPAQGQPVERRYIPEITPCEGSEIMDILTGIELARGQDFQFAGRQINFLTMLWRRAIGA